MIEPNITVQIETSLSLLLPILTVKMIQLWIQKYIYKQTLTSKQAWQISHIQTNQTNQYACRLLQTTNYVLKTRTDHLNNI